MGNSPITIIAQRDAAEAAPASPPHGIAQLYKKYRDELVRYAAYTFGQGPPEPEDVAQSTFTQFAEQYPNTDIENPRALLYRIARNYVFDHRRRIKVREQFARSPDVERVSARSDEIDAERVLDAKERLAIILNVIRALAPTQRDIVILSRLHGLNNSEIARQRRISEAQVRRALASAMLACEAALSEKTTNTKPNRSEEV